MRFAGAFPLWLAPVQVKILPIADRHQEAAHKAVEKLQSLGIRAESDDRSEKIGYKIREAQLMKVPYMLVIGDKEVENGTVSVRSRSEGDLGSKTLEEFSESAMQEIKTKEIK